MSPHHLLRALLLLIFLLPVTSPAYAVTFVVGTCPGATHGDFATAYNALSNEGSGPHTLRLCSGTHTTPQVNASWVHAGLTIESTSGNAGDTILHASGGTLMTTAHQHFTLRNFTVSGDISVGNSGTPFRFNGMVINGNISAGSSTLAFENTHLTGNATSSGGPINLSGGSVTGNLRAQNGITSTHTDISGSITATNGGISLSGGTIAADIGTDGASQPITLSDVVMPGGSIATGGSTVTIHNSQIGSEGSSVPINANNGITVTDSEIWGDLTAQNWATISLNAATTVYGSCTPEPTGDGTCGAAPSTLVVGDCTATPGFPTIQAAVDAADTDATIRICPGIYDESVTVNKDQLTFDSTTQNRDDVTVRNHGAVFSLERPETMIRNLSIVSTGDRGITSNWGGHSPRGFENLRIDSVLTGIYIDRALTASAPALLENLQVDSANGNGIEFGPNARGNFTLRNIQVSAPSGDGIMAHRGFDLLEDFEIEAGGRGIAIQGGESSGPDTHDIRNGVIGMHGLEPGIFVIASRPVVIDSVTIQGDNQGRGVFVRRSQAFRMANSCVVGVEDGIETHAEGRNIEIESNAFFDYTGFGVDINSFANTNVDVIGNAFHKNSAPRARSNSNSHSFDGNFWLDATLNPAGHYVDGNIRDRNPLQVAPDIACFEPEPTGELVFEALMEQDIWSGTPGEVLDTSGSGFHGTAEGSTNTAVTTPALPGNPGTCRYGVFDGEDSGVFVGNEIDYGFGNDLTVMAWVRWSIDPADGNPWANIFTSNAVTGSGDNGQFWLQHSQFNDAFEIAVQTDEVRRFQLSQTVPQQGVWYHLAGVYDGNASRLRLYVNGVLEGHRSLQGSSVAPAAGNATHIGRWSRPGYRRFSGNIDEVRAFTRALDAAEIQEWMNTRHSCEEQPLDHVRLEHSGAGLTCRAEAITVRACADTDCNATFVDPVTVNFTSPAGNWTPTVLTFAETATVNLQVTEPGSVVLDATSDPAAPVRCFVGAIETCAMEWAEAGFVIEVPDHVSATTASGFLRAVRADDNSEACVPAFADVSREVNLWSEFLNPVDGSLAVSVGGTPLPGADPGAAITLAFDADGQAVLPVTYPDAGRMRIRARMEGTGDEAGLLMTGQGDFVARPERLTVAIDSNPGTDSPTEPFFQAAGEPFAVRVAALNAAGTRTANFGRESAPETVIVGLDGELVAPVGGHLPGLVGSLNAFGRDCDDQPGGIPGEACGRFQWHEVGSLRLTPELTSGPYLGSALVPGETSGSVGRFIPSHFRLGGSSLTDRIAVPGCNSDFTYLGEPLAVEFTLIAQSTDDLTTRNYDDALGFARMGPGQLNLSASPVPQISSPMLDWSEGIGAASAVLTPSRDVPAEPVAPYTVTTAAIDADGVGLQGSNTVGSTRLVFGRIVVDNAIGSELWDLDLPWRVEHWEDQTWQVHTADECTGFDLDSEVSLHNEQGSHTGSESIAVGTGSTVIIGADSVLRAESGRGHFRFAAPGAPGWVDLQLELDTTWPFLRDDLDDDGVFGEDPRARASFGLFDGNPRRILLREVLPL